MSVSTLNLPPTPLANPIRVALWGKLAGMTQRDAQEILRARGYVVLETAEGETDWLVIGEHDLPAEGFAKLRERWDEALRGAIDAGRTELLTETELWRRLGFVESDHLVQQLYTPAMLAELLAVPLAQVRRWQRRGLLQPVREVRRLAYFDFREVAAGRRLKEWTAAGLAPRSIERHLEALRRQFPHVERPLADLPLVLEDRRLLLRQGEGLSEVGGQLRFDFNPEMEPVETVDSSFGHAAPASADRLAELTPTASPDELLQLAADLEEAGQLPAAADMYRAALAAGGPSPEISFMLAELLYRLGDLSAARERYFMAIELDENYVEARANLGCVLAEQGERELAVSAFEGALAYHPDYADVYFHLARTLDELNRRNEAEDHWRTFLRLAPQSPWAEQARERLEEVR